jgi:hypothetical protein
MSSESSSPEKAIHLEFILDPEVLLNSKYILKNVKGRKMQWYAAHIVMSIDIKDGNSDPISIFENIIVIQASSHKTASKKAKAFAKEQEGDDNGTFKWCDKPAFLKFAGIRKTVLCVDPQSDQWDGKEVTYSEFELPNQKSLAKFLQGNEVSLRCTDHFRS